VLVHHWVHSTHPDACLVDFEQVAHKFTKVDAALRDEVEGELAAIPENF
jgi:hypothetical protein